MTNIFKKNSYELLLVFVAALWGLAFPLTKLASGLDAIPFIAIRFSIAAVVLTFLNMKKLKQINIKMLIPCAGLGILLTIHSFFLTEGIQYTSAANAAFITSTNPVFVPIFLLVLFREKSKKSAILGLALMMVGFLFVSEIITLNPFSFKMTALNYGDFMILLCAIFTGLYMVYNNRVAAKFDADLANYIHFVFAAISSLILWLIFPEQRADFSSPTTIIPVLYWGILGNALCFLWVMKAQPKLNAVKVSVLCSLEPIFATIFALFIPAPDGSVATLSLTFLIGAILIFAGVLVTTVLPSSKN